MAGDWIKMRTDLIDDPAVISIGVAVNIGEDLVVGKLYRLWTWADKHTEDGNAVGVTENWVDRYLGVPNFAQAMQKAGWLDIKTDGIMFPRFDRHNGKSAKKRCLTAIRVAEHKNKSANAASVSRALPREEKSIACLIDDEGKKSNGRKNGVVWFKSLESVTTENLKSIEATCAIHRACHREHPNLIPPDEKTLLRFIGAAIRDVEANKGSEWFKGLVAKQSWRNLTGDQRQLAAKRLAAYRERLKTIENPPAEIFPLCDERKDSE
jgi:hypothetical protein